jgi:hypothetical protein
VCVCVCVCVYVYVCVSVGMSLNFISWIRFGTTNDMFWFGKYKWLVYSALVGIYRDLDKS